MKNRFLENKTLLTLNVILILAIISMDICYINIPEQPYIYKTLASVLFVILGAINFAFVYKRTDQRSPLFKYFMLIGLVFACLGDILLIDFFIIGAILFAVGHIFFFISYCMLHKPNWLDLIISLLIFAVALIVILVPQIYDFNGMLPIVIIYALIISFMLGKAISNLFRKEYKLSNLWIMLGSLLFFLSDLMLLLNMFTDISGSFGTLCLALYYPAEILLATSIYYANRKTTENHQKNS